MRFALTKLPGISMPRASSIAAGAALILAISFTLPAASQTPVVKEFEVQTPRTFGYVIGDVFRQRVHLELYPPYRLEIESLPLRGRINRWLEIRSTVLERPGAQGASVYDIDLDYQIFNAPLKLQQLSTPARSLSVGGPDGPMELPIPEWTFSVAPIVSTQGYGNELPWAVRPARPPPPMPVAPHLWRAALAGALLAIVIIYLCWLRWGVPLMARANRPFARAYRDLRRLNRRALDESVYQLALRRLHGAFNETAGRALFADQLAAFHSSHPRFRGLEHAIDGLFAESRSVFFSSDSQAPADGSELRRLIGLCHECRERERRTP